MTEEQYNALMEKLQAQNSLLLELNRKVDMLIHQTPPVSQPNIPLSFPDTTVAQNPFNPTAYSVCTAQLTDCSSNATPSLAADKNVNDK